MTISPLDPKTVQAGAAGSGEDRQALKTAEEALSRIQRYAHAAEDDRLTPSEAIEQILDELAARPALGRVRQALGRSFSPTRPH